MLLPTGFTGCFECKSQTLFNFIIISIFIIQRVSLFQLLARDDHVVDFLPGVHWNIIHFWKNALLSVPRPKSRQLQMDEMRICFEVPTCLS